MSEYEVNFSGDQPVPEEAPAPQKTAKRSPFADAPYIMPHQPEEDTADAVCVEEPVACECAVEPTEEPSTCDVQATVTEEPAPKKAKKARKCGKRIVAALLVLALLVTGCGLTAFSVNCYWNNKYDALEDHIDELYDIVDTLKQQIKNDSFTGNGNSVSGTPNSADGLTPGQVYAKCVSSVVAVSASYSNKGSSGTSLGTGFIISEDGYIITNHHVVDDATKIVITTHDGEEYEATLIGSHEANDLAVLKADATGLSAAQLGSSTDLIVGDQVVAIGNALGVLTSTLTVGYVSGKDRTINTDGSVINMIQTDAAINSGNSGGPLFNMKGEVIGITSGKYSGTSSSGVGIEGLCFAIPIDDVKDTISYIQANGSVAKPYMGVIITNQYDGLGVYVDSVEKGGAADLAGMRSGDLIVAMDGAPVKTMNSLTLKISGHRVGDTVTFTVYRNGQLIELDLTFAEKPEE